MKCKVQFGEETLFDVPVRRAIRTGAESLQDIWLSLRAGISIGGNLLLQEHKVLRVIVYPASILKLAAATMLLTLCLATNVLAATYYVSKAGSDSNAGSQSAPWLTVQKAANTMVAGDSANIAAGSYAEVVAATASGTPSSRITFAGPGTVGGFKLRGNYITLTNLTLDGSLVASTGSLLDMRTVLPTGPSSFNLVANCTLNSKSTAGLVGANIAGSSNVVQGCTLQNFKATQHFQISGSYNLITQCLLTNGVDADAFYLFSHDNRVSSNEVVALTNPNWQTSVHADFIQTFGDNGEQSTNMIVDANYVHDCSIQICNLTTDVGDIHDWDIRNNVLANVTSPGFVGIKRARWHNNVFYKCSTQNAVLLFYQQPNYDCTGDEVVNNVFLQCGTTPSSPTSGTLSSSGTDMLPVLRIEHNYFGGTAYAAKTVNETIGKNYVNGGNPKFVNESTYNFHLQAGSPLIGAGTNLFASFTKDKDGQTRPASGPWDIGAYEYYSNSPSTNPVISVLPGSLDFGSIAAGATKDLSLTVRNAGAGTLAGTASVAAPFSIVAGGTYSLGSNQTQTVTVRYSPTTVGANSQTVTFTGGGGASASVSGSATNLPPVVSAITQNGADIDPNASGLQIYAGSVVQYSGSAYDPNGDPISWQWIYTVNGGSEVVLLSGTGTVASVAFNYTAGTAGNTYVWKLRVSDGHATSESDLTVGVETPPLPAGDLTFSATSGTVSSPFTITSNYIYQAVQTTGVTNGGRASYSFTITNAGSYVIQALVNAPNDGANSFYLNMDAEPQDPTMIWDIPLTAGFEQRVVSWRGNGTDANNQFVPKIFTLTQGSHQLIIRGREANVQLETLAILKVPPPWQSGLRIVSVP